MRLGILDCDRLDPDLVGDFGPVYSEMFIKGFRAVAPELEFRGWSALDGDLPPDLTECDASLITGSVCGVKVQEVEDPLMRRIRYLDKLVDELARGKAMDKVLRG